MKKHNCILLILILLSINMSAQVAYDTIPSKEVEFSGIYWDELFAFKDFNAQALAYFSKIDFKSIDCKGGKVYVSTIFGKEGKLKNTCIVKTTNPACDSIAFNFVSGLKDWLPGLSRGKFVDIPFVFSFSFDSLVVKGNYVRREQFFNANADEFEKRREYFDFFYSDSASKIVNDFTFFSKYLTEKIGGESFHVFCMEYVRPSRRNSVKVEVTNEEKEDISYVVYYTDKPRLLFYIEAKEKGLVWWDKYSWTIETNFTPAKKKGALYLEKNRKAVLMAFVKGKDQPKLAIYKNVVFRNDTILNLDLKVRNKSELQDVIKHIFD